MARDEILMGAIGEMFSLQVPENGGLTEDLIKAGSISRGISGVQTVDSHGVRGKYSISWEDLTEDHCSELRQLFLLLRSWRRPLRLVLPHRKNMMSAAGSTAWSVQAPRAVVKPYEESEPGLNVTLLETPRPDQDPTYGLEPRLPRIIQLKNEITDYISAFPEGHPDRSPYGLIPVVEGRTYTVSVYYRRTVTMGFGPGAVRVGHRREDADLTGPPSFEATTLDSPTWTWASVTSTIPAGWPAAYPLLTLGQGETIQVAAMQFEEGPVRTPWVMGYGVPVVAVTDLTFTDTEWPRRNATLTAIEL